VIFLRKIQLIKIKLKKILKGHSYGVRGSFVDVFLCSGSLESLLEACLAWYD
jgi:hypothetical protein